MKDWSYLAALYDGEGCFHIRRQYQTKDHENFSNYFLMMPISMCSIKIMKWLLKNFGGVYYPVRKDERFKNPKPRWVWHPKGKKNKEALLLGLLPFLVEKVDQAKVALEFIRLNGQHPEERARLCDLLRSLKRESVETNTLDSMIESDLVREDESALLVTADA
jgi:hypothetical protein